MISYNTLGNCGRLGNQMFQYAGLKGIASKHNYDFCIPPKSEFGKLDPKVKNSGCDLYDVFGLDKKNKIQMTKFKYVEEKFPNFDENIFENCEDNIDLGGYFQSEKYFKHIEDEIRKDFTFDEQLFVDANRFLAEFYPGQDVISLHVRRGDYKNFPDHHPICTLEYYAKALSLIDSSISFEDPDIETPVIIFTDDEEWVEKQPLFDGDRFIISQENTVDFDLCLMTCCDYHIIANSSFSWWGAWLARSKGVIAPKNWFGPSLNGWKIEDRILDQWVTI